MKLHLLSLKYLLVIIILLLHVPVQAKVYRCVQDNGSVLYSDHECPVNKNITTSATTKTPVATESSSPADAKKSEFFSEKLWTPLSLNNLEPIFTIIKSFNFLKILPCFYTLMSIICFFAYKIDKRAALANTRRTPESRLHLYEFFGGWPGGLLAQKILRHKNRKPSYQIEFWLIVSINVIITGYILWLQHS